MKKIEVKHLKLRRGSIFITFSRTCFLLHIRWVLCVCHICMYWTPRLLLGHPGSFRSAHILKCMRTQTGPRFNVSSEGRGTTTRVAHPYPYGTSRAGNRTRVVVGGVTVANHYTTGPAEREGTEMGL